MLTSIQQIIQYKYDVQKIWISKSLTSYVIYVDHNGSTFLYFQPIALATKFTVVHDTCVSMMIYVAEWEHMFFLVFFNQGLLVGFGLLVLEFEGLSTKPIYTVLGDFRIPQQLQPTLGSHQAFSDAYGSCFERGQRVKDDLMQRANFTSIWDW